MKKAFERQNDIKDEEVQVYQHKASRAAGIAVVKAISKQTRKEASRVTSDESPSNTEKDFWLLKGRKLLRRAALEFKHKDVLVRLGNLSLKEALKVGIYTYYIFNFCCVSKRNIFFWTTRHRQQYA